MKELRTHNEMEPLEAEREGAPPDGPAAPEPASNFWPHSRGAVPGVVLELGSPGRLISRADQRTRSSRPLGSLGTTVAGSIETSDRRSVKCRIDASFT